MKTKWQKTMAAFDAYERRFAAARAAKAPYAPWVESDRETILEDAKSMLAYKEELVPSIGAMEEMGRMGFDGYDAITYRYQTWPRFYGAATLYLPRTTKQVPLVFVCCGHGEEGRRTDCYAAMGHRLASLGIAALVMDNIGQGDRNFRSPEDRSEDHWYAVAPFYCGLTLQGLIVMETLALIRHMAKDPRFDAKRLAACGNSGGGTLTMFLSALAPELSVIASSGYPSEIPYILQKERRHCACNLLLGLAHKADMWEIYSLFAPKPLLLSGGRHDNLIPQDLFLRNARKVKNTYVQFEREESFTYKLTNTRHSWELEDLNLISGFLSKHLLRLEATPASQMVTKADLPIQMPKDCLSTAQLCQSLTGIQMPEGTKLQDVFKPTYQGKPMDPDSLQEDVGRGDVMQVFAQFECALLQEKEFSPWQRKKSSTT